ncbi:MAG TPA: amino acid adenylation domain-containing protein, partial [Longimicrobiaceae bacterium]
MADLRRLPADAREAAVRRAAAGDAARPFDLARGPVARAGLLRTAEDEWVLLLSLHHVAGDGWSTDVFVRELSAFYDARLRGGEAALPPLAVQYADFAAWQRAWLTGEVLERQLAWWRARLAGAPPVLELPTDRPHAPARSPREAYHPVVLPAATWRAVRELSRREGATPFMTLLAAWQLLLARYSGQDDVSVGTPIAGRTRLETEGLIGFFVNTLVLRTELPDWSGFRALLGRVREGTLGAFAHQEVPFERLVEELAAERSLTHTPLFQVLFSLRSDHAGAVSMGPLRLEPIAAEEGTAVFDLGLELAEAGEELSGAFSYRTDLFDGATVERMGRHYAALLDAVLAEPERSVHEIGFLAAPERERLLTEWGARPGAAAPFVPVHEAVSRRARSAPGAVSVLFEGATLTYAELEERTERLARLLARRGVGPETRVGVCMERSLGLVAAILAVLRAGGACVPLDPENPAERLAYVLADAGVRLLLADASTVDAVPAYAGETLLVGTGAPDEDAGSVLPDVEPRSAAYVVYTSGSTGRPKGVVVEHAAVASHVAAFAGVLGIGPADRVLHAASAGFDVSMEQILVTLSAGATLVLRGPEPWNPADWPARARALGITVADLPPAYWQEVIESGAGEALPDLRVLVVGVDAVPSAAVPRWRGALDTPARLVNGYGPTEAVVTATVYEVPVHYPAEYAGAAVPVGGPLPGRAAYVLDRAGSPVPVGVPGELHLGGSLLARGYLGRPDMTAERFVPDPFGAEPGARLYRTGDRVRWLASGALEFLGRTDAQVKVRGFRVEPGEVEAALLEHPGVREAAVVAREDAPGERRLVAYVVGEASAAELRARLKGRLPEYMVPSAFVALEALPLTPGGKVDRRALPAPERTGEVDAYVAPRTPTEEILAGIYAEVLGVERVGATDDFFALAGHSLLAMRLVSRVREALGTELPLRAVFEAPTVAGLAERVEAGARAVAPPIVPVPRDRPLPLSFAQQRLWFLDQLQPGSAAYNIPAALRLHGRLDTAALRKSLSEVVRRHESLRTVLGVADGEPVQVIREAAAVALPVVDLRVLPVEARERETLRLAGEEAARPFDLAAGPLLRSSLLRLDEEEWALLFTLHHVVSDGWSMEVLVREASALYGAHAEGGEAALPELPVQYADYSVWQRGWLAGEVLEAQLAWWRRRLAGAPPVLELPTDRPRPTVQDGRGARVPFALSAEATHALGELSRRGGATLFMTLLAAWQLLLARHSGQEDVSVGVPVAGRGRVEVEGLIGFF